jgi:hypothetical protein
MPGGAVEEGPTLNPEMPAAFEVLERAWASADRGSAEQHFLPTEALAGFYHPETWDESALCRLSSSW